MKKKDLKEKSITEIKLDLISLYRKRLKLILEKSNNPNFKNAHELRNVKKSLARTLTFIGEKIRVKK